MVRRNYCASFPVQSQWVDLPTAKDEELRRKGEALRVGEKLLKKMPELRTKDEISWEEKGAEENIRMLCELLKGNAIPTKILDIYGNEKDNK